MSAATNGAQSPEPVRVPALDASRDTFPKLVAANAERLGDKVAIREKDYGIWQAYTWRDYLDQARLIALGLAALGFARGDKTAIIGDNRPQLYWAMLATQALGGVPVPLYQDSIEKEMQYILDHCRGALRRGRGPGAGGQAPPREGAVRAPRATSSTTIRAGSGTTPSPSS